MTDKSLRPAQTVGVMIALLGPAMVVWARNVGLAPASLFDQRIMSTVALWGLVILLISWVATAEQQPLTSIGFKRPSLVGAGWGLAAAVGLILVLNIIDYVFPQGARGDDPGGLLTLPLWMRIALVVSSAVTEEVLFRGYPITRLKALTGSTVLAAGVPLIAFVALHVPTFGLEAVASVGISGAVFTALFLWRKDLWSNITAHFVLNLVALVIQPQLAALGR